MELKVGTLSFDGHATLGDFVGKTSTIKGRMFGGPDLSSVTGWVEAPVGTLASGNDLRDRDLRKSMEVDRYPTMRFDLTSVLVDSVNGDTSLVTLTGSFTIHGVKREVALPAKVARSGAGYRVLASTPLDVRDYRVGGLTKMLGLLKMNPTTEVHVDLTFAPTD